jgi:hypothetical protein
MLLWWVLARAHIQAMGLPVRRNRPPSLDTFKKSNYMASTDHNEDYWSILPQDRVALNLWRLFNKMIYEMIDAFMSNMPIFEPPYFWDFMDTNDNIYILNYVNQETKTIAQDQNSCGRKPSSSFSWFQSIFVECSWNTIMCSMSKTRAKQKLVLWHPNFTHSKTICMMSSISEPYYSWGRD